MSNFFNAFVPEKQKAVLLPIGEHDVVLKQVVPVTDHDANLSGSQKTGYAYSDMHDQLAVTFVVINGKGVMTERFNTLGFARFDELSPKEQKKYRNDDLLADGTPNKNAKGYAIDKHGNRVIDPVRTEQCKSVFNQFLNQLSDEDGTPTIERIAGKEFELESIVGTRCRVTVEETTYKGEKRNRITKYRRITSKPVLVPEGSDGEDQMPI